MKHLLTVTLCCFSILGIAQTIPSYVPTNSLMAWYPFNANANDESGNGNNGTVNGATLTFDRFGNQNSAYVFNGNQQNITASSFSGASNLLTVSYWVKMPLNGGGTALVQNTSTPPYNTTFQASHGNLYQRVLYSKTCTDAQALQDTNTTNLVNEWHHIAFTIDQNSDCKVFVNGVLKKTLDGVNFTFCNPVGGSFRIGGKWLDSDIQWFNGSIDDIGIWNRVLNQSEVTALFKGCVLNVTTHPVNQIATIGNSALFFVKASDTTATFQWQTDLGVGFQNLNNVGQYSGAKDDTLIVANVNAQNSNQPFRCIVTKGLCSDTSDVALLNISNSVGVNDFFSLTDIQIFPNPVSHQLQINTSEKLIGSSYQIIDLTGKEVISGKLNLLHNNIDVSLLAKGYYELRLSHLITHSFKIIKH